MLYTLTYLGTLSRTCLVDGEAENKMHNGFDVVHQLLKHDEGKFTFKVGIFAKMPPSMTANHTDHVEH